VAQKTVADGAPEMPLPQYVERAVIASDRGARFPKDLCSVVDKGRAFAQSLRTDSPIGAMRSRPETERALRREAEHLEPLRL